MSYQHRRAIYAVSTDEMFYYEHDKCIDCGRKFKKRLSDSETAHFLIREFVVEVI